MRRADLVNDYLHNRLDEVELEEFEISLLDSPELQEQVALEMQMRDELRAHSDLVLSQSTQKVWWTKLFGGLSSPTWSYVATASASAAIVILAFTPGEVAHPKAYIVQSKVYLEATRSDAASQLRVSADKVQMLYIDVARFENRSLRLTLSTQEKVYFSAPGISANREYELSVLIPKLNPGEYTLTIVDEAKQLPELVFTIFAINS